MPRTAVRHLELVSSQTPGDMLQRRWFDLCEAWAAFAACPWCPSKLMAWTRAYDRFESERLRYSMSINQHEETR
jgi:hypothetical protein